MSDKPGQPNPKRDETPLDQILKRKADSPFELLETEGWPNDLAQLLQRPDKVNEYLVSQSPEGKLDDLLTGVNGNLDAAARRLASNLSSLKGQRFNSRETMEQESASLKILLNRNARKLRMSTLLRLSRLKVSCWYYDDGYPSGSRNHMRANPGYQQSNLGWPCAYAAETELRRRLWGLKFWLRDK